MFWIRVSPTKILTQAVKVLSCLLVSFAAMLAYGQSSENDAVIKAHEAVASRNWVAAESMLVRLAQSQPKNPFVLYDLAQVYENTNRADLAKQIYQGLTSGLGADPNQHTVLIRTPFASRLVSLVSLAQAKLNAITAKEVVEIAPRSVAVIPPAPIIIESSAVSSTLTASATSSSSVAQRADTLDASSSLVGGSAASSLIVDSASPVISKQLHSTIVSALKVWASAWANKDVTNYIASYTPEFRGDFSTRTVWEHKRLDAISRESNVEINFRNIELTVISPKSVRAKFVQSYFSDSQSNRTYKTMLFSNVNGRWLIDRENTK